MQSKVILLFGEWGASLRILKICSRVSAGGCAGCCTGRCTGFVPAKSTIRPSSLSTKSLGNSQSPIMIQHYGKTVATGSAWIFDRKMLVGASRANHCDSWPIFFLVWRIHKAAYIAIAFPCGPKTRIRWSQGKVSVDSIHSPMMRAEMLCRWVPVESCTDASHACTG